MGKVVRRIILAVIAAALVLTYFQWHAYEIKAEERSNALIYFKEEDYTKAIQYLNAGLARRSLFGGTLDNDMTSYLAESYYHLQEYAEAEKLYGALIRDNKKDPIYYHMKGKCSEASEDYEEAVKVYEQGWEETGEIDFLEKICDVYMEQQDYEKALDYARKGAETDGEPGAAMLYKIIIIYEQEGDYKSAYEAAEDYCGKYPKDEKGRKEMVFLSTRV